MPTVTQLPNGQVLTSSALAPKQISSLFQQLTAQMLGLNPQGPSDPAYAKVILDWPTNGQPAWSIHQDICAVGCVPVDDPYDKTRDFLVQPFDALNVEQAVGYTRCWKVAWTFYGPNSFDDARIVKDFLLLDWAHDQLAQSNLYLVTDTTAPRRVPELFQGQWWERTDLEMRFYEEVISSISVGMIQSIPADITTPGGLTLGFTVDSDGNTTQGVTYTIPGQGDANVLIGSVLLSSPLLPDGSSLAIGTIPISGAIAGKPALVGVYPPLPNEITASGQVTSTNTVTVTLTNLSGKSQTPPAATYTVIVF